MTAVCLLPQALIVQFNITFQLGGTALLIVVVVVMDFYGPGSDAFDVASVRITDEEVKSSELWSALKASVADR